MAPLKRKRPHDDPDPAASSSTRRTTRHTAASAQDSDKSLRSGRVRASAIEDAPTKPEPAAVPRGRRGDALSSKIVNQPLAADTEVALSSVPVPVVQKTSNMRSVKNTRQGRESEVDGVERERTAIPPPVLPIVSPKLTSKPLPSGPGDVRRPIKETAVPVPKIPTSALRTLPQQTAIAPPKIGAQAQKLQGASTAQTTSKAVASPATAAPEKPNKLDASFKKKVKEKERRRSVDTSTSKDSDQDRNIDKVVLGNVCFRAWYPSYFAKEVLGDITGNSGKSQHPNGSVTIGGSEKGGKEAGAKSHSRRDKETPMLDRLYVCPCCFKYSKELVTWWEHVQICETKNWVPGRKVYIHPKSKPGITGLSGNASAAAPKAKAKRTFSATEREKADDEGEWSIWEVDGEKEVVSPPAKSLKLQPAHGFNYFLLVYTPPSRPTVTPVPIPIPPNSPPPRPIPSTTTETQVLPSGPRIVGFFSKEKMSWDNNNLACILVFPPWQRKSLGALLMGISYEISKREGILGGPEKPISDLGRKGYKRFWAGEIARWLLASDLEEAEEGGETLIDVADISQATWIVPEDCLAVLKEMGVVVDAGIGPAKVPKPKPQEGEEQEEQMAVEEKKDEMVEKKEVKQVQRVRVDKEAIRKWVKDNKIGLDRTCDPEGFVEGYALNAETEKEE